MQLLLLAPFGLAETACALCKSHSLFVTLRSVVVNVGHEVCNIVLLCP